MWAVLWGQLFGHTYSLEVLRAWVASPALQAERIGVLGQKASDRWARARRQSPMPRGVQDTQGQQQIGPNLVLVSLR